MPSSPMQLQEHLMREVQPPISEIAQEIAPQVVEQIEWAVWSDVTNREREALEPSNVDQAPASILVQAIPVKPPR